MKSEWFRPMKERLVKRMTMWPDKKMSMGGKKVLIKSVAQDIPTYVMGVFI